MWCCDDSDMKQDGDNIDRDAAILAAEFASNDFKQEDEDVAVMDDDSDGENDIPTINVGGEEFDITDVTTEIIAKMTTEEMEKYNQLYQDFYKDILILHQVEILYCDAVKILNPLEKNFSRDKKNTHAVSLGDQIPGKGQVFKIVQKFCDS